MPPDPPIFTAEQLAYVEQAQSVTTCIARQDAHLSMLLGHADPVVVYAARMFAPIIEAWAGANTPTFEREVVTIEIVLTGGEGVQYFVGKSGIEDLQLPNENLIPTSPHMMFERNDTGWLVQAATEIIIDGESLAPREVSPITDGQVVRIGWTELVVRIPGP